MYLEIYLGLLSASAIVASLMTYRSDSRMGNRRLRLSIIFFGISALTSALGLLATIFYNPYNSQQMLTIDPIIALFSVTSFITATELLLLEAKNIF